MKSVGSFVFSPAIVLASSVLLLFLALWTFADVYLGWPKRWASTTYVLSLFIAPALAAGSAIDLRRRWNIKPLIAFLCAFVAFLLAGLTTYLIIHPRQLPG